MSRKPGWADTLCRQPHACCSFSLAQVNCLHCQAQQQRQVAVPRFATGPQPKATGALALPKDGGRRTGNDQTSSAATAPQTNIPLSNCQSCCSCTLLHLQRCTKCMHSRPPQACAAIMLGAVCMTPPLKLPVPAPASAALSTAASAVMMAAVQLSSMAAVQLSSEAESRASSCCW